MQSAGGVALDAALLYMREWDLSPMLLQAVGRALMTTRARAGGHYSPVMISVWDHRMGEYAEIEFSIAFAAPAPQEVALRFEKALRLEHEWLMEPEEAYFWDRVLGEFDDLPSDWSSGS